MTSTGLADTSAARLRLALACGEGSLNPPKLGRSSTARQEVPLLLPPPPPPCSRPSPAVCAPLHHGEYILLPRIIAILRCGVFPTTRSDQSLKKKKSQANKILPTRRETVKRRNRCSSDSGPNRPRRSESSTWAGPDVPRQSRRSTPSRTVRNGEARSSRRFHAKCLEFTNSA